MVAMKHTVANLLLNPAMSLGARRVTVKVIKDSYTQAAAEAMLTASLVWGVDEAKAIAAFLNSPAGQLFSKRIRSVAAHVAIEGAKDRANTIRSAGVSAGWNECVRYIHSLSRVSGDQDTGRVGLSDTNDGHQPDGEAELVERLSP
jgi:hypothetical protein